MATACRLACECACLPELHMPHSLHALKLFAYPIAGPPFLP